MNKKPITIGIIDYGAGNIFSVQNACDRNNIQHLIVKESSTFQNIDGLILPGVGSFKQAVINLKEMGIWEDLIKYTKEDRPFLGICLGMQLLFQEGKEFGITSGLNIFSNSVTHFNDFNTKNNKLKIPHMGWTEVTTPNNKIELFSGMENPFYAYFAHSFMIENNNQDSIIGSSKYNDIPFCAAVQRSNIYGVQFHPEKSAEEGLLIYRNFHKICEDFKESLEYKNE